MDVFLGARRATSVLGGEYLNLKTQTGWRSPTARQNVARALCVAFPGAMADVVNDGHWHLRLHRRDFADDAAWVALDVAALNQALQKQGRQIRFVEAIVPQVTDATVFDICCGYPVTDWEMRILAGLPEVISAAHSPHPLKRGTVIEAVLHLDPQRETAWRAASVAIKTALAITL